MARRLRRPLNADRHRARPGWPRRLVAAAVLAGVLTGLSVLAAPLAYSIPSPIKLCDNDQAPIPEEPDAGSANLMGTPIGAVAPVVVPIPTLRVDQGTLYGRYGTGGQSWATYKLGCADPRDLANAALNAFANQVFGWVKLAVTATLTLHQIVFDPHLLDGFLPVVNDVVHGIRDALWLDYLMPVVMLGSAALAWRAFRSRVSGAVEGAAWMVGAIAFALWFFTNPAGIVNGANQLVGGISQQVYAGIGTVTAQGGKPAAVRDQIWRALVFQPWLAGEFGAGASSSAAAQRYGEELLDAQAYTYDEAGRLVRDPSQGDPRNHGSLAARKQAKYKELAKRLEADYPAAYAHFRGTQSGSRQSTAWLALVASICACLVLFILGCANVLYQLAMLLLVLMSPAFLLLGVHPGAGRGLALRWLDMMVGAVLKRIFCQLLFAVLVIAYSIVLSPQMVPGWFTSILLTVLLGAAIIIYRRPFLKLFSSLTLSGAAQAMESFHSDRAKPVRSAFRALLAYKTTQFLFRHAKKGGAWPPVQARTPATSTAWQPPAGYVLSIGSAPVTPPPFNPGAAQQSRPYWQAFRTDTVPNQPTTTPKVTVAAVNGQPALPAPPRALNPPPGNGSGSPTGGGK